MWWWIELCVDARACACLCVCVCAELTKFVKHDDDDNRQNGIAVFGNKCIRTLSHSPFADFSSSFISFVSSLCHSLALFECSVDRTRHCHSFKGKSNAFFSRSFHGKKRKNVRYWTPLILFLCIFLVQSFLGVHKKNQTNYGNWWCYRKNGENFRIPRLFAAFSAVSIFSCPFYLLINVSTDFSTFFSQNDKDLQSHVNDFVKTYCP